MTHDAVILAGGAARRLGGAVKPEVTVRGRRLLDHVLDATGQARRVVVVAPETVSVPDGVARTLEDPPLGGPVAGVAAGLRALGEPAPWVVLLACDLPGAASAVPRLLAAVAELPAHDGSATGAAPAGNSAVAGFSTAGGEVGVVMRDGEGRMQWLLGVYDSAVLRARLAEHAARGGIRGASMHRLLSPLPLASVLARADEAQDVDTWNAVRSME